MKGKSGFYAALTAGAVGGLLVFLAVRGPAPSGPKDERVPAVRKEGERPPRRAPQSVQLPRARKRVRDPMHEVRAQEKRLSEKERYWLERYPRFRTGWLVKRREHQVEYYRAQRNNVEPPPFPDIESTVKEWLARENRKFDDPRQIAPEFFDK